MIFLKNATYIDYKTLEFKETNIKVFEGIDKRIELLDEIPTDIPQENIIDCKGKYVTKSFGCGHHHVYSALARGMNAPKKNPENFNEILQYVWWTLDKSLDKDMIEASALVTAINSAKSGVSFVIDHHASPFAVKGSLDVLAKAFEKVGVSHLLCYEISDRDGFEIAQKGLEETENYLKTRQGLVGLHASFTVGDETLKQSVEMAKKYNSGIHVHTAEDKYDQEHCLDKNGKRVVERFAEAGVLDFSKTILGHCLHLNENEKALVEKSPVYVVQNMESNLNNNVGHLNATGMGKRIMFGTDGMHSDMLRSAKSAFFVGQNFDCIDYPGVYERFRMVHNYLEQNEIKGDGENNLVILDYKTPTPFNQNNFLGHFVFGLDSSHVSHLISDGKLIMKDRIMLNVNEDEVMEFAQEQAQKLWNEMSKH